MGAQIGVSVPPPSVWKKLVRGAALMQRPLGLSLHILGWGPSGFPWGGVHMCIS